MSRLINQRRTRRDFMNLAGVGIAGLAGASLLRAAEGSDADLVVFNAKVYTVDSRLPKAEAFAIKANRFLAVGTTAEMKGLIGK